MKNEWVDDRAFASRNVPLQNDPMRRERGLFEGEASCVFVLGVHTLATLH
jgi:hypothetical protein